jgi:alpha-methylacyl-CoA racemase
VADAFRHWLMPALAGVQVVEIASGGGLPLAAMLLADMGADVIRIERAGSGRAELGSAAVRRNRRSITVDLRHPKGVEVVRRLANTSAALVEGLRPGVAEAIGIGPDACCTDNPTLVYGRLTGWGQIGPGATRAGHDLNFLAATGVLDAPGVAATAGLRPPVTVADRGAPALLFAFGVMCALFEAARSGRGQVVDCASVDAYLLMAAKFGPTDDEASEPPTHLGAPYYGVYPTADRGYVAVAAVEPARYRALIDGLGFADGELPDQHDSTTWQSARGLIANAFAAHDLGHWTAVFGGRDAGVTPVRRAAEARTDPQLAARESFTSALGTWQPNALPLLDRTPGVLRTAAPARGADYRSVLSTAGYPPAEIDELTASCAVVPPPN